MSERVHDVEERPLADASIYTLPRREAFGLVYRKAKGKHGVSRRQALAAGLRAFFSSRERRTVPWRHG